MLKDNNQSNGFKEIEEDKFRLLDIIENSLNEIFIFDSTTLKFEYANKGALQNLGYSLDEIINLTPVDIKPEYTYDSFRHTIQPLISGHKNKLIFETIHRRKDGSDYPVEVHLQLHIQKEKSSFFAIINNITQRKISEEVLRESEEKYKALYFNAPLSYQSLDKEGNFLDINPMWLQTLGYKQEEVIGKWFGDFLTPEFVDSFRVNFQRFKTQGYTNDVQFKMKRKDGSSIYVSFDGRIGHNLDGSFKHTYCVFQDITDRKEAEQALKNSEAALIEAQDIAHVGNWDYNVEADKTKWSKEMFRIFGRDQSLREPSWLEHRSSIHPDDWEKVNTAVQAAIQEGTPYSLEFRIVNPDGKISWAWTVGKVERNSRGVVSRLYGTVQEITDRKLTEENLQKIKERWESLFHNSPSAIAVYNAVEEGKDFIFTDINLMVQKTEKLNYHEVIGKRVTELFPSAEKQGFLGVFRKVFQTGKTEYMKTTLYDDGRVKGWRENTVYKLNTGEIVAIYNDVSDRMNAEIALRQSEQKFRSIFENHSAIKLLIDPDTGDIVDANPVAAKYYGWSLDELKHMKIQQITTSLHDEVNNTMQTIKNLGSANLEFKHLLKDGTVRDVEVFSSKIEIGGKIFLHSITHDITERKKAEEKLKASEERYRGFISQVSEGVYRFECDRHMEISLPLEEQVDFIYDHMYIAECNKAFLEMYGMTEESQMIGKGHLEFHGGRYNPGNRQTIRSFIEQGYHIENAITEEANAEGQAMYFSNNSLGIVENNKLVRIWGTQVDITEKLRTEQVQQVLYTISNAALSSFNLSELLEIIREQLGKLLDSTNFFIAFYDEVSGMLSTNYDVDQKDQIESWPVEKSLTGYVIKHQVSLLARDTEIAKLRKSGEIGLVGTPSKIWLGVPLIVNKKSIGAIVVQSYDNPDAYTEKDKLMLEFISNQVSISIERKKAEQDLREALVKAQESDRLKSAFLANMSHEIRTPMNGILGFLELLSEPDLKEKNKIKYIDIINKSGQRLLNTINDLIEISKIEAGEIDVNYEEIDLEKMMKFYHDFFLPQTTFKGLRLKINEQLAGTSGMIEADKHKLDSIMTNLIKNAIKFTSEGSIELGNYLGNGSLVFYVKDSGIGIPSDRLDAIFERFVQADTRLTRAYEGSGLGLSIVKAYVEMLNGNLWVNSKVGEGSTFYFSIPYKPVTTEPTEIVLKDEIHLAADKKLTILIAEDDEYSFLYLESLLNNPTFTLLHAPNGEDTLKIFQENPEVSLILMDIKMPGMNGFEATKHIRQLNKSVPIIAQTAYALEGDKEMAMKAGCNDYIAKPIKKDELLQLIVKYTQ